MALNLFPNISFALSSNFYSTSPDIFLTPLFSQPSARMTYPSSTSREKYWIIFRVRKSAVSWLNCIIKNTKESARKGLSNTIQFLTAISSGIPAKLNLKLEACLSLNHSNLSALSLRTPFFPVKDHFYCSFQGKEKKTVHKLT